MSFKTKGLISLNLTQSTKPCETNNTFDESMGTVVLPKDLDDISIPMDV
jgi:hypothetical protein